MPAFYLPTHEWARQDGPDVLIGLSAFAASEVGEVIHVQLPKVGAVLVRGKPCAEIESVKSVNEFYAPVDGTVLAVNGELSAHPELVNQDPSGKGWFVRVRASAANPFTGLVSEADYQKTTGK